jgi:nucleoside-diphosphate-sugar epimerase
VSFVVEGWVLSREMSRGATKILVTGATGFVGSALCPALKSFGDIRAALWNETERQLLPPYVSPVVVGSITRDTDWTQALDGIDAIVHLAARVHVMKDSSSDPLADFREVNTRGTEALARQALSAGVKRFIYVSTIKVNGEKTKEGRAFTEGDPANPQEPYAISKMEAETALTQMSRDVGLRVTIVRPPMMYGPDVKANFLSLMKLVDRAIPLPTRSIKNGRSLLYVKNLADFLVWCLKEPASIDQLYLLSDGFDVSTSELISTIARAMNRPDRQFAFPDRLAKTGSKILKRENVYSRLWDSLRIDSTKARQQLNWRPHFTFAEGIKATVDRYLG